MFLTLLKWPFIKVLDYFDLYAPLVLRNGALKEDGWFKSYRLQVPVDYNNKPLPWMPYPFIDFIVTRLDHNMNILEFGSGNSTLFFSDQVKSVTAVENNIDWFNTIKGRMPRNVTINYIDFSDGDKYCRFALASDYKYDIVIVDGRDRVNCIRNSIPVLTEAGVLILDDSERDKYTAGKHILINSGFKEIDFWGITPGQTYKKCTSVFYRLNNCLKL